MSNSTTFIQGTTITHQWLNDINNAVYGGLGGSTAIPTTPAATLAALGGYTFGSDANLRTLTVQTTSTFTGVATFNAAPSMPFGVGVTGGNFSGPTISGGSATSIALITPTLAGTITGTYTLAGTPSITNPTINGSSSGTFNWSATGVPYGSALHNNAGPVTGTTNQYITSGTYTPTLTNTTNIASSTGAHGVWMRVGNVVTVSGLFFMAQTAANTASLINLSLPIASNLAVNYDLGGVASRVDTTIVPMTIPCYADTTNDRVSFYFRSDANIASDAWVFNFQYEVLP